jgi:hypothetical protein
MYLNDNNVLYKGILERFIKNNKIESTNGITILSQTLIIIQKGLNYLIIMKKLIIIINIL